MYYLLGTEQHINNRGQTNVERNILIQLKIDQLEVNYVNTILYPVSGSNCRIPERDVLCISIGDLTSKCLYYSYHY